MTDTLTLESVDRDGAIREAADAVSGDRRADFLRKAVLGGGALAGGAALAALAPGVAAAATANDVRILNFALTLEYLEADFYTEALRMGALSGETRRFAQVAGAHERAHVVFLRRALGRAAVARPRFNFRGTTEAQGPFRATAILLEDTGVAAYAGQAPLIDGDAILKAALSVHSVEARHAAWIRDIAGQPPSPRAFDRPLTRAAVLAAVGRTGFITGTPTTQRAGAPSFTG